MALKQARIEILGNTIEATKAQLKSLSVQLGANDKTSSVQFEILDPDLAFADKLFTWSRANGGIKLPPEFGSQSPTNPSDPGSNGGTGSGGIGTGTGDSKGKLEGLEQYPMSVSAFVTCIGWAENRGYGKGDLYYNVYFGGSEFSGYDDHPRILYCSGSLCSDAAGAFQFLSTSWDELKGNHSDLKDFSPKYQNLGCIYAIQDYAQDSSAWDKIQEGSDQSIIDAARGCANYWASLPGSPYGQPTINEDQFLEHYKQVLSNAGYQYLYVPLSDYSVDSSSWKNCTRYADVKKQVTISIQNHGDEDVAYSAIKYLIQVNNLQGSFCMADTTEGNKAPVWRSKDFPDVNDDLYTYQAIFHKAGLFVLFDSVKQIPGFNAPGSYVKPSPEESPLHPNFQGSTGQETGTEGTEGTTDSSQTVNPVTTGEKIFIHIETLENKYKYSFILTGVQVPDISLGSVSVSGKAVKATLDFDKSTENFEDIAPDELIQVLASQYSIPVKLRTPITRQKIKRFETHNQTPLELALEVARNYDLSVVDDPKADQIEIVDDNLLAPKKINISNVVNISFRDDGVTSEEPLYPVSISAVTSDELLELLPRDNIDLSNVYSFVPDSLKKDKWVISTINHDLLNERTSLELLKYIPVTTSGTGTGTGGTFSESELLAKYETATVKVGSASGAFVSADGYILTAAHMKGSTNIQTRDGKTYTAREIDIDEKADIMLMKVDATGVNFFSIAPDSSIYPGNNEPIFKLGHGWSSEDGRGEGGREVKEWDITQSFVRSVDDSLGRGATYIIVDDKTIDFANPGDSGCPWFDKWGLIVSCTSGGDRSHEEGAGKKDRAWGGDTKYIIQMLDKNKVNYVKGSRETAPISNPTDPGSGGEGTASGGSPAKILSSLNSLGKFSTSEFFDPRNACAFSINKVVQNAGYGKIGSNELWVPDVRDALIGGRGKKVNKSNVVGGLIAISRGCYHIGITTSSSTIRSSSSSKQCFCWDSDITFDGYYDGMSVDGYNSETEYWEVVN